MSKNQDSMNEFDEELVVPEEEICPAMEIFPWDDSLPVWSPWENEFDEELIVPEEAIWNDSLPERSPWKCELFGGGSEGITWTPLKGKEPNWFWRWMQYLCFGNRWIKTDDKQEHPDPDSVQGRREQEGGAGPKVPLD